MSAEEKATAGTGAAAPGPSKSQLARNEGYRKISLVALVMLVTAAFGAYVTWLLSVGSLPDAVRKASDWLRDLSGLRLYAHLLVIGPFLIVLVVVTSLLIRHGLPK